jgi:hypothetical protein
MQVLGDNVNAGFEEAVLVDEGILMEGFGPPPGATYCMFPDEQELLLQSWDVFGAIIDTSTLRQEEGEQPYSTAAYLVGVWPSATQGQRHEAPGSVWWCPRAQPSPGLTQSVAVAQ